ncbi:hypothetical protein NEOLEDRAFT_1149431 [Neolentinus lepideus HHB14362 ss-1]|uniref:GST N-terminal domain-containing protein n=1 Tax=Neolentinus lepideus HHB14362 ss-1 TaxID=1314782 RepID=A0A165R4V7_9AGAM|nr:hypothetical protein NEOLEDRAFT_1149431 [Neolentinus lepideus HHB14362 ss-1]
MSQSKHLTLYSAMVKIFLTSTGPDRMEDHVLLEKLGLTYETVYVNLWAGEQKEPKFLELHPNGPIPAIVDHLCQDRDLTTDRLLIYDSTPRQVRLPSAKAYLAHSTAVKRYQDEIRRVTGALKIALSKSPWLVGGKFGVADMGTFGIAKEAPHVHEWCLRMLEQPSVEKAWAQYDECLARQDMARGSSKHRVSFCGIASCSLQSRINVKILTVIPPLGAPARA